MLKVIIILLVLGTGGYYWQRVQAEKLNPEVIVNPTYAEIHTHLTVPGRQIEAVILGKMVDQADCQKQNKIESLSSCSMCTMSTVECKAELIPRYANLFDSKPAAAAFLSLPRGVRPEREYRLIFWGVTAAESDKLCDMISAEFQKGRKGIVACTHSRVE